MRGVTAASRSATVGLRVSGSTSQKTERAPERATALAAPTKLIEGMRTSSPGPTPSSSTARNSPEVAELTKIICSAGTPMWAANPASKASVRSPCPSHCEAKTSATASSSSAPRVGRKMLIT